MRPVLLIIMISFGMLVSCYKPYDAHIDADKKILVVNGLITNENASYHVHLSYALPFDSSGASQPAYATNVHVTDESGNYYAFHELGNGYYASDSLQFTGKPGSTYTLHINTVDGEIYQSDPQRLFPVKYPDRVYAEFDYQETLSKISGLKVLTHGANILTDIRNESDTMPRYRFTTNLVIESISVVCPPYSSCDFYYYWQTENPNQYVNLTGGEYSINTSSRYKHAVGFIDDDLYRYSLINFKPFMISARIIYLNQYTLSNEAYLYYKNIDELLRSDGKLFDPIAIQLNGNIKCLSHPENKVFGFFEVSSVSNTSYKVDFRDLVNGQPSLTMVPYILPPELTGCWINKVPPFWVY
jgi:hypothetical protein